MQETEHKKYLSHQDAVTITKSHFPGGNDGKRTTSVVFPAKEKTQVVLLLKCSRNKETHTTACEL